MIPVLVVTSCCFVIPAIIGFKRGHKRDATAMSTLACLSVWNHSTQHPLALFVDKTYAHGFAIRYAIRAINLPGRKRDWFVRCVFCSGALCYMFELHRLIVPLHLGVHLSTIVAFSAHMLWKS